MMMALLTLKSRLKSFFEKHYRILRCFGKAVLMIITLMIITSQLNYQAFLANHWIVLLLAVICAVTPDMASPLCVFLVTEIEVFQVSELIGCHFADCVDLLSVVWTACESPECSAGIGSGAECPSD